MTALPKERSYQFADFIQFVAMCAIIFQYSFIVEKEILMEDYSSVILFFFLKVIAKIGSISFFVVSGFLLATALKRYSSKEYLNIRVKNIFKPYLLFVLLYLILDSIGAFFGQQKITSFAEFPAYGVSKILGILFFASSWFIFNYFISVMILLAFRNYLYEKWFGILLFCCALVYSINIHFEWFIPHHTIAFAGFTFFLWLGTNLKKYDQIFWKAIDSTPYWKLFFTVLITLGVNLYETFYLIEAGATVVGSSLKFTNILYALSVFLLLCKIGSDVRFGFRDETYPLYLIHPIFLKVINFGVLLMLPAVSSLLTLNSSAEVGWLAILLYQTGWFLAIYMISLMTVKIILYSPFRWVFGNREGWLYLRYSHFGY
jgi:fucose 4-O-acetylase-like acetyltransferase